MRGNTRQWSGLLLRVSCASALVALQACTSAPRVQAPVAPVNQHLVTSIDAQLRSDVLMNALADRFARQWQTLLGQLVTLETKDQTDAQLALGSARAIAGFRRQVAPQVRRLVRQMPDSLLHDYFHLRMQTYRWYGVHHPDACDALITGSGSAASQLLRQRFIRQLPRWLRHQHVEMTARVIRNGENAPRPTSAAAHPGAPGMLKSVPRNACLTMADRIGELLLLPAVRRVHHLRQMLPRDTPPRYRAPAALHLTDTGQLFLHGSIGQGTASLLAAMLRAHPTVNRLVLDSPGGLLSEAITLADLVRSHGMDTLVINRCDSACTVVLVAGRKRLATAAARIGFHRPALAGEPDHPSLLYRVAADYRLLYPASTVSTGFLSRVADTPSTDLWYPTWLELLDNGVITGQHRLR